MVTIVDLLGGMDTSFSRFEGYLRTLNTSGVAIRLKYTIITNVEWVKVTSKFV
jgi:hypothetical protein